MRISHKYKFVFLAVPRTGSTTVRKILDDYSDVKSLHISKVTDMYPYYHHIPAGKLKKIFADKGWDWGSYRKFCVVRNPYDRVVSLYHHNHKMIENKEKRKRPLKYFFLKRIGVTYQTFYEYVNKLNTLNGLATSLENFISDEDGNVLVEDVLMFENLKSDLSRYLNNLGIQIKREDVPHLNSSSRRKNYKNYYDEETRQIIKRLYAYEIERFGYSY